MGSDTEAQHIEDDQMRNPSPLRAATPITSRGHYDLDEQSGAWAVPSYQPQRPQPPNEGQMGLINITGHNIVPSSLVFALTSFMSI